MIIYLYKKSTLSLPKPTQGCLLVIFDLPKNFPPKKKQAVGAGGTREISSSLHGTKSEDQHGTAFLSWKTSHESLFLQKKRGVGFQKSPALR